MKRFFYFLAWVIIISFIFYGSMKWRLQLEVNASHNFNLFPIVMFSVLFPVVMGMLFRLPKLLLEIRLGKKWTLDFSKLLAIGLPCLIILVLYTLANFGITHALHIFLISGSTLPTIVGLVLGYTFLASLKAQ